MASPFEEGDKPRWVTFKNCAFDQSNVFKEGVMSHNQVQKLVEEHPGELIGFCYNKEYPTYRWVVRRGTAKFPQKGWSCRVWKVRLPKTTQVSLFSDDFAGKVSSFGAAATGMGWARPGRGEGVGDTLQDVDMIQGVDPNDLRQGGLGDCWLISSFAALAEFPSHVSELVTPNMLAKDGKYTVNLFDYGQQKVVPVVVDDRIPRGQYDQPAFTGFSKDGEIWPCIFEKAVAKLAGSYENLDSGDPAFALGMLTGTPSSNLVEFMFINGAWACLQPDFKSSNPHDRANQFFYYNWPDGTPGDQGKDGSYLINMLAEYDDKDFLMCCGTHAGSDKDVNSFGIVQGHAYTIIRVVLNVANSGRNMLQLRNPWGTGEWKGDWSDESDMWFQHPNIKRELDYEAADDGIFWIQDKDFFKNYSSIMVCCKTMPKNRVKQEKIARVEQEQARASGKLDKDVPPLVRTRPPSKEEKRRIPVGTTEIPGRQTLQLSVGSQVEIMRLPGYGEEEWQELVAHLEEHPEDARRWVEWCKDSTAVRAWVQQKTMKDYYQESFYSDAAVYGKLSSLEWDPQFSMIFADVRRGGFRAAEMYHNNAQLMAKLSRAVGGVPEDIKAPLEKIKESPVTLHDACKLGDLDAVERHVQGHSEKLPALLEEQDARGVTCLAYAVGANRVEVVKLLLEQKADASKCDAKGGTGLHYAAAYGRQELMDFFIDAGLEVNAKMTGGETPLALATRNKQQAAVQLLAAKGGKA